MHVELVELLRCPANHAESQLIAATTRTDDRHIVEGVLGCPVCGAEYPITNGIAQIGVAQGGTPRPADRDTAMRIAAFLDLTDANGFALLSGSWCSQLDGVQRIAETPLVALNPPGAVEGLPAAVVVSPLAPFAPGSLRAAAIDTALSPAMLASIVRSVRGGGRVIAPVGLEVPEGVRELDRDAYLWVGERELRPMVVPLTRHR